MEKKGTVVVSIAKRKTSSKMRTEKRRLNLTVRSLVLNARMWGWIEY